MSALNAFLTTWSQARATFGEGVPVDGGQFDQSARIREARDQVASAAPGSSWSGTAADAYSQKNARHVDRLGSFGSLDQRAAAEVQNSAAVVITGRRNLDVVKQWVADAAALVPNTAAGQRMLWPIVSKGSSDVQSIVSLSNDELSGIAGNLRKIGDEYERLGTDLDETDDAVKFYDDGDGKKVGDLPDTTFDLRDIKYTKVPLDINDPATHAPRGYMELVPGTGVWVPDPKSPDYRPTPVEAPLGVEDVHFYGPGVKGLPWEMELYPGSGVWIPDPDHPTYRPQVPEAPIDLSKVEIVDPEKKIPATKMELWPKSGVIIPDPRLKDLNHP